MAVNIEVNLEGVSGDVEKIKRQIKHLDDIDLDVDLDDVISGDLDDIEVNIDEDRLQDQIRRAFHKVNGDIEAGVFDPFGGGGDGGGDAQRNQLGIIIRELQAIKRAIYTTEGEGIIPGKDDDDAFDLSIGNLNRSSAQSIFDEPNLRGQEFEGLIPEGQRDHIFRGNRIEEILGAVNTAPSLEKRNYRRLLDQPESGTATAFRRGAAFSVDGDFRAVDRLRMKTARLKRKTDALNNAGDTIQRTFNRLRPTFRGIRAVTTTLLPAVAALGAQLLAVGTALGILGAAGATIGLLGMLGGQADTLEGSMKQAEERMKSFKQSLFQAIQPVADLFAPIVKRFLDAVVQNVRGLRGELAGLRSFSGIFFDGLDAAFTLFEDILNVTNRMQPQIEYVARLFGGIISNGLPRFLQNVIKEGAKTADTMQDVGVLVWQLLRLLYSAVKVISNFLGVLSAFSGIISSIADILGNKWIQSLLVTVATFGTFFAVVIALSKALKSFLLVTAAVNAALATNAGLASTIASIWSGTWIASAIKGITSLISWVWALNGALGITAKLATLATGGLAAAGAAILGGGLMKEIGNIMNPDVPKSGGGMPTGGAAAIGGGQKSVEMNFYGQMDNSSQQRMLDKTKNFMHQDELSNGRFGTK